MNKRDFMRASAALIASSTVPGFLAGDERHGPLKNWSGNYTYSTDRVDTPSDLADLQRVLKGRAKVKALGSRHSFNAIADTTGDQVSLLQHFGQMAIDTKAHTVTVGAGLKYGQLAPYLDQHGFALHNLASLPHITVAGACATATHGSGNKNGNLATAVRGFQLVGADGNVHTLSSERDGELFRGAVVGLGALGVITTVTLNLVPSFRMRQVVYENLSFDHLKDNLERIFGSGYSVSLFTDWQHHRATQVWIKSRVEANDAQAIPKEFYGAKAATQNLHPITGHSAESCTEQMGVPGPWYERLPHFKMNFTPSSGDELQSEYFVPRDKGYEAILAVEKLRDHITPHLFVTELRTIDADDLWMSTCHQRPSMTIHFTWKPEWTAVRRVLPMIEEQLAPFDARPHWAKLFTMAPPRLRALYPKLKDFRELAKRYDPGGKFVNRFLNDNLSL